MADLTDSLTQLLEGQTSQIGQRIGADDGQTRSALQSAVPALMAALGAEANRPDGGGLRQAIERDHDGAILDNLDGYLSGTSNLSARTTNGAGILEHVLGERQQPLEQALSAKSGLDMSTIAKLLPLIAPIVLGMLGRKGSSSGNGFGLDDLGSILGQETDSARSRNPDIGDILDSFTGGSGAAGGIGDVLDSVLGRKGG